MMVSFHVAAGWGLSFLHDEPERTVFTCMSYICHLGLQIQISTPA